MCYNKTQAFYYKSKCLAHTFTFGELRAYRQIMPQPGGYGIMKTQAFIINQNASRIRSPSANSAHIGKLCHSLAAMA